MTGRGSLRMVAVSTAAALTVSGCAFQGVNSLPLPGAKGRTSDSVTYHVELPNVNTLESNSPVMIDDVIVGSVGTLTVDNWHADVEVSIEPDVVVPANAVASVGQTSLLGSMHVQLGPPIGEEPEGRLEPGATIPLERNLSYPSTEQTLSALSVVVNSGGLGQIGDIIHNFNIALAGRQNDVRDLIGRLDRFIGTLDDQSENIVATIEALDRLSVTFADQRDVIERALREIPPALDVLVQQRPNLVTALDRLRVFSNTTTGLINDTKDDLIKDLENLAPVIKALADVGPDLTIALAYAPTFPWTQDFLDRGIRGDYLNLFAVIDLTVPRLKRTLFLGTRWADPDAVLVPAPGDPYFQVYTYDPLGAGISPPPPEDAVGAPVEGEVVPQGIGPLPGPAPAEGAPVPVPGEVAPTVPGEVAPTAPAPAGVQPLPPAVEAPPVDPVPDPNVPVPDPNSPLPSEVG